MTNYKDYLKDQLQDEVFKKEWDALDTEFAIIQEMIAAMEEAEKSGFVPEEEVDWNDLGKYAE